MSSTRTASFSVFGWLAVLVSAGCQRDASAQVTSEPLGPIRCFQTVDAANLSQQSALQLCAAALTDAPGRCYVIGVNQLQELSEQKVLSLCQSATSLAPIACYARLDAIGTLTEDQMIQYCATTCSLGPPPAQVSSPACLDYAARFTDLSLQSAGELCFRSRSAGPVQCYLSGSNIHKLADSDLVQLCAESRRCQYEY